MHDLLPVWPFIPKSIQVMAFLVLVLYLKRTIDSEWVQTKHDNHTTVTYDSHHDLRYFETIPMV